MFPGNNNHTPSKPLVDCRFQYPEEESDPLHSCGNWDAEAIPGQLKLQLPLNDKTDGKMTLLNPNPVSTGLRLSYDADDLNLSMFAARRKPMATSSVFYSQNNDIRRELNQQKEELDHFIRIQEENMMKGIRDMRRRHTVSVLTDLEEGILKRLREKDLELESITRKNEELVESMKRATSEAQHWCYTAQQNESNLNMLKTSLDQAMQSSGQGKEGFGENGQDDAVSGIHPNNSNKSMICRCCKLNEVSVVLMPCRHLCLCRKCEGFVKVCPVCQMITTARFEVYLSS